MSEEPQTRTSDAPREGSLRIQLQDGRGSRSTTVQVWAGGAWVSLRAITSVEFRADAESDTVSAKLTFCSLALDFITPPERYAVEVAMRHARNVIAAAPGVKP
jgi:hypothetical protein